MTSCSSLPVKVPPAYCQPRSRWTIVPLTRLGERLCHAISGALLLFLAVISSLIDQPTVRRLHRSSTVVRHSQPCRVEIYVMSPPQTALDLWTVKLWSWRFGVTGTGRLV